MKKINLEDQSEARGYRAILISQQPQYLKRLQLDKSLNFDSVVTVPFSFTHTADRNAATLDIPVFSPINYIAAPAGATHFCFLHALGVVSDFAYNDQTKSYKPINTDNNELSIVAYSGYLPLDTDTKAETIEATLAGASTLTKDVSVIECVGIEFYQQVRVIYYRFSSGNCMKIVEIF